MSWKRKMIYTLFVGAFAMLFFFPHVGYAVDYSITNVKIDAFLQENGQVEVKESHTYNFEGEFNGITREIVPKEESSISSLAAAENGNELRIEREDSLYKIYRKGEDESITIEISYSIHNGVNVYSDVAEFYWPFFDDRNESTYENMTIIIHPPRVTSSVIAFGYDEAYKTEEIQADGSVLFQLGHVPAGENGEIRVTYDASLFPAAPMTAKKTKKNEIILAEQNLAEKAAAKEKMRETLSTIAVIVIPVFIVLLIFFIYITIMRARMKKLDIERKVHSTFFIPKEVLSLPATICFTKGMAFLPAQAMSAALLDLMRKGNVSKTKEQHFRIERSSDNLLEHEQILIQFLFHEIGVNGEFNLDDLKTYTKNSNNHGKFQSALMKWQQAIIKELKAHNLYEKNTKFRSLLASLGIIIMPLVILFAAYDLFGWFTASIILMITYLLFALFYKPRTSKGLMISKEWQLVKERLPELHKKDWDMLSTDEQMRAYIYGIGTNDKDIVERNKEFVQSFRQPFDSHTDDSSYSSINMNTLLLTGPILSSSFHSAHSTTNSAINDSSTSGGGGAGGGGGGSGAF